MHDDNKGFTLACDLIKKFEGCKLKAYKCPAGKWTIGYGHTNSVNEQMEITQEEADQLLQQDVIKYYKIVMNHVGDICNANQIAALTSLCFNIGGGAFMQSTLLKCVKNSVNDFDTIKPKFLAWCHIRGNESLGLLNRRKAEAEIYAS